MALNRLFGEASFRFSDLNSYNDRSFTEDQTEINGTSLKINIKGL